MRINPLTAIDFYKSGHKFQYPDGTTLVYSNFTPRSTKLSNLPEIYNDNKIVFFGLQYFIKSFLMDAFNEEFFKKPKKEAVAAYKRRMDTSLGADAVPVDHIKALHDLGYLPLEIKALPEGVTVNEKVPVLTIKNTHPDFYWLTNYVESILSCYLWKPCTSATTARFYKTILRGFQELTGSPDWLVDFQAHDFSFRGMSGIQDAMMSGAAHLVFFKGTDTVPAIDFLEAYYNANAEKELIGGSVPATEHSVMCMGGKESEFETFERLITKTYPKGIVSVVSDTWDFWKVVTDVVTQLKDKIMARDGKLVIRPDSGDPVKIICGDKSAKVGSPEFKGAVECLWDVFGGTTTDSGYKLLDSHIGLIYGDSITPKRALDILTGLAVKGFASGNIVFGVGSFTYEYVTRDTYGFAVKSTYGEINGEGVEIFKDPVTDSGIKKSARGLLKVIKNAQEEYELVDRVQADAPKIPLIKDELEVVFRNGNLLVDHTLAEVRKRAHI